MNASFQNDNLPVSMGASFEKANSLSTSADKALSASKTEQSAYEQSYGSAMSQMFGNVTQGSYDKSWGSVKDAGTRHALSEGASAVQSLSKNLSSGTGISQDQMAQMIGKAGLSTGKDLSSLSGDISKKYGSQAAAKFEKNLQSADQEDIRKAANFEQTLANSQSARDGISFGGSQRQGIESNLQKAASHKQAATAALQESNSYREQASEAYKSALTGGVDLAAMGEVRAAHAALNEARTNPNFRFQTPAARAGQLAEMTQNNLALMSAPVGNDASPVLTGGNAGITTAHTGNVASVAATGNPAQYVNAAPTNLAAFQQAVNAGQGQVDAQGKPIETAVTTAQTTAEKNIATGNATLAADPNNPVNKGVTVGARGAPVVTSSQVGDVTYAAAQDAVVTAKNVVDGPVGKSVQNSLDAFQNNLTPYSERNNALEIKFTGKNNDVPEIPSKK